MGGQERTVARRASGGRLLAAALAVALAVFASLFAVPAQARADEVPTFKANENFGPALASFSYGLFDDYGLLHYGLFYPANDAAQNLDTGEANALVASVASSDESVVRVVKETFDDGSYSYYIKGVKKGSATVTMTDVYGNAYSNVVDVVYWESWADYIFENMHRLYNPNSGEHFYTADVNEVDSVVSAGWSYEGIGWAAPKSSGTPVYRLYNPNPSPETGSGEHHYTTSAEERDSLLALGWQDEGIGWYSDDAQGVSLYRLYNPNEWNNNHHYTTSTEERDYLLSLGWRDEGIAWYGMNVGMG